MNHKLVEQAEQHLKQQYEWVQATYVDPAKNDLLQKRLQYADELAAAKGVTVGLKFQLPYTYYWGNDNTLFVVPTTKYMDAKVTAIRYLGADDCLIFFQAVDPNNKQRPEEHYNLSLFVKFLKSE